MLKADLVGFLVSAVQRHWLGISQLKIYLYIVLGKQKSPNSNVMMCKAYYILYSFILGTSVELN